MKNWILFALLIVVVSGLPTQSPVAADHPMLLVTDRDGNLLYFINADTYEVTGSLKTGKGPQEVIVSPDWKTAFVANFHDHRNIITVVDLDKLEKIKELSPAPYFRPHGMAVTGDGKKLYVTCEANRTVAEMNIATGEVLRGLTTSEHLSHMLVLSPDEKMVYTANSHSGNVSYIALVEGMRSGRVFSGNGCEGIAISPDGTELWTSNRRAGTVSIIDTKEKKLLTTVECLGYPVRVKFTPDGKRVMVVCASYNLVNVFDTESYESIDVIATNQVPVGIDITPDGKRAFTANNGEPSVTVIDVENLKPIESFQLGTYPFGIAYVKAAGRR